MRYDPTRTGECNVIAKTLFQQQQCSFLGLLAAEQAEDEALLKERLSSWSPARLKEEGYCLTGLSAFWLQANQFGRPVAAFLLGPGRALPENRFEYAQILSFPAQYVTSHPAGMEHKFLSLV